jgi:hypothetical protein
MNAWWRCRAVGLRLPRGAPSSVTQPPASAAGASASASKARKAHKHGARCGGPNGGCGGPSGGCAEVLVRYAGYGSDDDEWRATCNLRKAASVDAHFCTAVERFSGELVEVSAPPCPGHPPALWQASIRAVEAADGKRRKNKDLPNKDVRALVRFADFAAEFDEWVAADSRRIRPPGAPGGQACKLFAAARS